MATSSRRWRCHCTRLLSGTCVPRLDADVSIRQKSGDKGIANAMWHAVLPMVVSPGWSHQDTAAVGPLKNSKTTYETCPTKTFFDVRRYVSRFKPIVICFRGAKDILAEGG